METGFSKDIRCHEWYYPKDALYMFPSIWCLYFCFLISVYKQLCRDSGASQEWPTQYPATGNKLSYITNNLALLSLTCCSVFMCFDLWMQNTQSRTPLREDWSLPRYLTTCTPIYGICWVTSALWCILNFTHTFLYFILIWITSTI